MDKNILVNGRLELIEKQNTWSQDRAFMFTYHGRQVAKISFQGNSLNVVPISTFDPWAYVSNDKGQYFARIHKVEDQIHGVNVIETHNLQALYLELTVNNSASMAATLTRIKTGNDFAAAFDEEAKHIINTR